MRLLEKIGRQFVRASIEKPYLLIKSSRGPLVIEAFNTEDALRAHVLGSIHPREIESHLRTVVAVLRVDYDGETEDITERVYGEVLEELLLRAQSTTRSLQDYLGTLMKELEDSDGK